MEDGSDPVHGYGEVDGHLNYFLSRWYVRDGRLPDALLRFTFVRNPYQRFLSFYKSKIQDQQRPGDFYQRFGLHAGSSLDETIETITSLDVRELEHHSQPQAHIALLDDEPLVDFVAKLEDADTQWPVICRIVNYDVALPRRNVSREGSSLTLSAQQKAKLYRYYEADFEIFGYDPEIEPRSDDASYRRVSATLQASSSRIREAGALDLSPETARELGDEIVQRTLGATERRIRKDLDAVRRSVEQSAARLTTLTDLSEGLTQLTDQVASVQQTASEGITQVTELLEAERARLSDATLMVGQQISDLERLQSALDRRLDELRDDQISALHDQDAALSSLQSASSQTAASVKTISEQQQRAANQTKQQLEKLRQTAVQATEASSRHGAVLEDQMRRHCEMTQAMFAAKSDSRWSRLTRRIRFGKVNELEMVLSSGLVDGAFYFSEYPHAAHAGLSAAEHYLRSGAARGYDPSADFSTINYLMDNPEAVLLGVNPLVHRQLSMQRSAS